MGDTDNQAIRKIDLSTGEVTTPAYGSSNCEDQFGFFAIDRANGVLYSAGYRAVFKLVLATSQWSKIVGSCNSWGDQDGSNPGYGDINGIALSPDGKQLYVADGYGYDRLRALDLTTLISSTIAGGKDGCCYDGVGDNFRPGGLWGMDVDSAGNVYLADVDAYRVWMVNPTTREGRAIVGGDYGYDDGFGSEAKFGRTAAVAVGPAGRLFVLDPGNDRIRVVD